MKPLIQHVSDTAIWVAFCRAKESDRPDALVHDRLASLLVGDRGAAIEEEMAQLAPAMERWMGVRTAVLDEMVLSAIETQGCDTVVNLACGLDTRPYRLPLPPSVRWFEADFPRLIAHKEAVLATEHPHCQLVRRAIDLEIAADRARLLDEVASGATRALVLTEGLLMYWSPATVAALARDLARRTVYRFWLLDLLSTWGLGHIRDDFRAHLGPVVAALRFAPDEGPRFFEPLGWKPQEARSAMDEAGRLLGAEEAERLAQSDVFVRHDPDQERLRDHYRFVLLERSQPGRAGSLAP